MISLRNIFIAAVWKASRYINLIPSRRKIKIHRVKIVEGKGFEDNVLPSSLSLSSSRDLPEVSATCWILGSKAHTFPPAGRHLVAEQNRHDAEWRPSTWPLPIASRAVCFVDGHREEEKKNLWFVCATLFPPSASFTAVKFEATVRRSNRKFWLSMRLNRLLTGEERGKAARKGW